MRVQSLSLSLALPVCVTLHATPREPFAPAPYSARVRVVVSSYPSSDELSSLVKSFLTRDLRELRDVTVDDADPDWIIEIIAMKTSVAGRVTGYAVSYTLRQPLEAGLTLSLSPQAASSSTDRWLQERNRETTEQLGAITEPLFQRLANSLSHYRDHQLMLGPMESLKDTCQGIVADFDTKHLEPSRQEWNSLNRRMMDEVQKKLDEAKKKPRP